MLKKVWLVGVGALLLGANALAQSTHYQDYRRLISTSGISGSVGPDLFGEQVNFYTGQTEFEATDVSIPGNNGLQVSVNRIYDVQPFEPGRENNKQFADWELDLPRITGVFSAADKWRVPGQGAEADKRCTNFNSPRPVATSPTSTFAADEYWQGYVIRIPGQNPRELIKRAPGLPTGQQFGDQLTNNWSIVRCLPALVTGPESTGEGFEMVAPNGVTYTFGKLAYRNYIPLSRPGGTMVAAEPGRGGDESGSLGDPGVVPEVESLPRVMGILWVTKMRDRFGNQVNFNWDPNHAERLNSISSSDGRSLTFSYSIQGPGNRISSVSDGTRTWSYVYDHPTGRLIEVNAPGAMKWSINFASLNTHTWQYPNQSSCTSVPAADNTSSVQATITHPSGAVGTFTFRAIRRGRSNTPSTCYQIPGTAYSVPYHVRAFDSLGLVTKSIDGAAWQYDYDTCQSTGCGPTVGTTVKAPDDSKTEYRFRTGHNGDEGLLDSIQSGGSPTSYLRTQNFVYYSGGANGQYPELMGSVFQNRGDVPRKIRQRPLLGEYLCESGRLFGRVYSDLDTYGNPGEIKRGSVPYSSGECFAESSSLAKLDQLTYSHNTASWVLGNVIKVQSGTVVEEESTLDSLSMPLTVHRFGRLVGKYTYFDNSPLQEGALKSVEDGNGKITQFSNYHRGIPRRIDYPGGAFSSATVSNAGNLTSFTNERSKTWTFGFDGANRVTLIDPPDTQATTIVYSKPSTWRSVATSGTLVTTTIYNTYLQPTSIAEGSLRTRTFGYDDLGRRTFASYPSSSLGITWDYDALGRIKSVSDGGRVTSYAYLADYELRVTDPRLNKTTLSYKTDDVPHRNWPVSVTEEIGSSPRLTTITRNTYGLIESMTRGGFTRDFEYNSKLDLTSATDPEGGTTLFTSYDPVGNLLQESHSGSVITYTYDDRNRLKTKTVPGVGTTTNIYLLDGLLSSSDLPGTDGSKRSFSYDDAGRVISERLEVNGGGDYTVSYAYGVDGNLRETTYPDGTIVALDPNLLGYPTKVGTYATNVAHFSNGLPSSWKFGNNIEHTATLNTRQRLQTLRDGNVFNYTYSYDNNDNITGIADAIVGATDRTFGYDELNRLTSATYGTNTQSYTYDNADNILTAAGLNYVYAPTSNRLTSITQNGSTVSTFSYDARGNTTSDGTRTFLFDRANQLRELTRPGDESWITLTERFSYDAFGMRIRARWFRPGETTVIQEQSFYGHQGQLLWSTGRREYETCSGTTALNTFSTKYIYLGLSLIATEDKGTCTTRVRYQHVDQVGTVLARTDASGTIVDQIQSNAYGITSTAVTPDRVAMGFGSHYQDMSGLVYMQARYYDPKIGRFLSIDPVGPGNTAGNFNRYWYANNNPVGMWDPDGRIAMCAPAPQLCLTAARIAAKETVRAVAKPIGNAITRSVDNAMANAMQNVYFDELGQMQSVTQEESDETAEEGANSEEGEGKKDVTKRPSRVRKGTEQGNWDNAEDGESGGKLCPTCGKEVKSKPGEKNKDWDNDHVEKWKDRDLKGKDRKGVLDEYNRDTRLRCVGCNRSDNGN
jgi:RHS repeat-associated protein